MDPECPKYVEVMEKYYLTVGLEVHAELSTRTKMFCGSKNDPDEKRSNVNICPVCMGYPGTLPVINKEAVRSVLRVGVAVGGRLADYTEFDRKNYFYPDIPKGYQISQYKYPLVSGGAIGGVSLTRIHLEEDTARSTHDTSDASLLDFNRAGVPLLELVTEPVIHTPEEASLFARELQLLLIYLGVSEANMEKGEMRVEANISISPSTGLGAGKLGTKVEVKNLNSFRAVERAIRYEYERHVSILESGETVNQETRGWNEDKQETFSQRAKEDSHDYRYFPDPDLPKLFINEVPEFSEDVLRGTLPELPWQKRERYSLLGISPEDVEVYVRDKEWGAMFEEVAEILKEASLIKMASNYITTDLKEPIAAGNLAEVIYMLNEGLISSRGAKDILKIVEAEGGEPRDIASAKGLIQESDVSALREVAQKIISENAKVAEEYKSGKEASLEFLIGQGMKETRGSANPQVLKKIFLELLA